MDGPRKDYIQLGNLDTKLNFLCSYLCFIGSVPQMWVYNLELAQNPEKNKGAIMHACVCCVLWGDFGREIAGYM